MPENNCKDTFYLEEYYDLIIQEGLPAEIVQVSCTQPLAGHYETITVSLEQSPPLSLNNYSFATIPRCFGLADTESLEASGIYTLQQYPGLNLTGKDIIVGFIDTGIDYTNEVFKNSFGQTRIEAIWDQTDTNGTPPAGFLYGSQYVREDINNALLSANPLETVPTDDRNGHGTAMASVAAGSRILSEDFIGAAPDSIIAVVKLKEAKNNLKNFYGINTDTPCFSESDIMSAVSYLLQLSKNLNKPLVIPLGLQTNQGDHDGNSPLGNLLNEISYQRNCCIVATTGNEADKRHHYEGRLRQGESEDVEIRVDEQTESFTLELFGSLSDTYSVAIVSTTGEELARIPAGNNQVTQHRFVFEQTDVQIEYLSAIPLGGAQLIQMRFKDVASGIWRIKVYANNEIRNPYHMWLPLEAFMSGDTFFIKPEPSITLSSLSASRSIITTSTYNASDESLYLSSGRGYTRTNNIKPDIASPGVGVFAVLPNNRYVERTGGSISSAICAGACALVLEWAITLGNKRNIDTAQIKALLVRGAQSERFREYPNEEWGYGILDLYESFESLRLN